MSIPARLGLVTLGTVDFDRLRAYYVALGWPIAVEEKDFCLFHTAGALLALYPRRELSQEAGGGPQAGEGFRHFSLAVNVASEAEVDAAIAAAVAAGGSLLHEPRAMFWGGYSGYFADPEGNAWEVAHNPHWTLDDRGMPVPPATQ
ncbi:MAG TPA: VOC family protein [Candidatus Dormibacteraeota bacterium]|nr:VOC family protein [Candidatus Dormibacteraeota bacterium]